MQKNKMYSLTKENAKDHCRTCLEILIKPENDSSDDDLDTLHLSRSINLQNNVDLERFLKQNVDVEILELDLNESMGFPQNVCLKCFKKVQMFENFRKQAVESARKLVSVFKESFPKSRSLDENEEILDMYNILMKDSLMETESILLNSPSANSLPNAEGLDPFHSSLVDESFSHGELVKEEYEVSINKMYPLEWLDDCNDSNSSSCDNDPDYRITMEESNCLKLKNMETETDQEHLEPDTENKSKIFPKKEKEKNHQSSPPSEKNEKIKRRSKGTRNNFKCDQCNHSFAHKITLDAHVRKVHEGSKKPFQCDRCEKSYSFIGGLYTHIKEVHEVEVRSHACDHPGCDRVYTSIIAMQKHKRLKHSETVEQKSYCCEQCGATFKQSGNLKYHLRTKHPTEEEKVEKEKEKEKYSCEICQKLFHSRYTLNYHKLQLHAGEMKYECSVCGRRMAKKFMLAQHMLVHSTDKMPCPHCTKQFIRKFELEAHIKAVHMKLKPFPCQYCGECFASRKTLRHHEYIHTGEKPYVCDICGQRYRQQTCLKNHRKLHFKNDEPSKDPNLNSFLVVNSL